MLISGYFSVTSNKTWGDIKRKVLVSHRSMLFYSIGLPLLGVAAGWWVLTSVDVVRMLLPTISREWYFMTLYLIVLFLSPYLNRCLVALKKSEFQALIAFLMVILSILPMMSRMDLFSSVVNIEQVVSPDGGKGLYGFVFMYIIGAYIRLHVKSHERAQLRYLAAFFGLTAVNVFLLYNVPGYRSTVGTFDNFFIILQGICLFLFFRDMQFQSVIINRIAALNLGVYMIHEHIKFRAVLWNKWLPLTQQKSFYMTWKYPIKIFLICVVIFSGCAVVEQIRLWIFAWCNQVVQKHKTVKSKQ